MQKMFLVVVSLCVVFLGTTGDCNAKKFMSNGYEVELYAKVKGKDLRIWGDIEGGKKCKRLKVYAHLSNSEYGDYASLNTIIKREHTPGSRSVYRGKSRIRSNKHKNGWFVDSLNVTCTNVKPLN